LVRVKYILIFIFLTTLLNSQVIYNAYANVTNISSSTFTVNNVNETNHTFVNGEQVIIMQMQDDVIGTNTTNISSFGNLASIQSAGLWEVKTINTQTRVAGVLTNISLVGAFANTYTTGSNASLQIITFRQLSGTAFTTTNSIIGAAWNGTVGGVIAFQVGTILTLNHNVTANALGFRGGGLSVNFYDGTTICTAGPFTSSLNTTNAFKGEGIYRSTNINFTNAIAKIINGGGGGGMINSGGGGGGNFTTGGQGGLGWSCNATTTSRGQGGLSLSGSISSSRIFMGGGGGGGQQNNTGGTNGGNGGGIILIKANNITTSCAGPISISANGQTAANSGNDGAGGGGAAGTILMQVNNYSVTATCSLAITANAGNGGNCTDGGQHAGGGGGAQGVIIFSTPQPTLNAGVSTNNGTAGTDWNGGATTATGGSGSNNSGIIVGATGPLPIELLNFQATNYEQNVALTWATATEKNTNYFYIEHSDDALNWKEIDKVKATENSNRTLYYETLDNQPINGVSYYRLKILDLDGSFSYSPIKSVNRTKKEAFVVFYPNPSSGIVNLSSSYKLSDITYQIFDVTGKQLSVQITEQNENKISFDFSSLSKGLYFINVFAPDGTQFKSNRILTK